MTLFELLIFGAYAFCGFEAASLAYDQWGLLAGIAAFPVGVMGAHGFTVFLGYLEEMMFRGRPAVPVCRAGTCQQKDYTLQLANRKWVWVCQCGGCYLKEGRHFLEIGQDNAKTPYLIWRPFRGWFPDSTN